MLNQYERGIGDLDRSIEFDPEDAMAYSQRGFAYVTLRKYELAIEDYDKAIGLDSEQALDYYNRGRAHRLLRQYELAIEDFSKAIELDPKNASRPRSEMSLCPKNLRMRKASIIQRRSKAGQLSTEIFRNK